MLICITIHTVYIPILYYYGLSVLLSFSSDEYYQLLTHLYISKVTMEMSINLVTSWNNSTIKNLLLKGALYLRFVHLFPSLKKQTLASKHF